MATKTAEKSRTAKPPKVKDQPLFIGGKWQDSVSGKTFATVNPATGQTICQVAEGDKADIDLAVKAARKAFEDGPWSKMNASERGRLLNKLADAIEKNQEELAALEALDNGKTYRDQSSVGLIFAKEPPKHRVLTKPIHNIKFILRQNKIPAGVDDYKLEGDFVFKNDGHIVGFMPHMHLRGKSFRFEALYPDGKSEILLSVPRYNFNWQSVYRLREPKAVPKGTTIHCVAHYDNSDKNPHNPDPKKDVYWGDQTWEEMMVGWMDFYYDTPEK